MSDFVEVARVEDIKEGKGKVVEANGKKVALFHLNGNFYAINNTCAHWDAPLGEGYLEGENVVCPLHALRYNIKTGVCPAAPDMKVDTYEVKVEDGKVKVKV